MITGSMGPGPAGERSALRSPRFGGIATDVLLTEAFDHSRVTALRHAVASCAGASGLCGDRLDDFVVAVNELLTNAVRHGGGHGRLTLWRDGTSVVCEVSDVGVGLGDTRTDPENRPRLDTPGGWGLWLAAELTDRMDISSDRNGTSVRIASAVGPQA
jgi:anti-sigma regulatory factor (Ser/Thr protein kinase)